MNLFGKRFSSLLAACGVALSCLGATMTSAVASPLVSSTFDSNSEGWSVVGFSSPAIQTAGSPPPVRDTLSVTYNATGGSPGGYISRVDGTKYDMFWSAPTKFLGNQSAAYGGNLHFDLRQSLTDKQWDQEDVILVGGGLVLAYDTPSNPLSTFTAYDISLSQGIWHVGKLNGALATQADMLQVLGSLSAMYIRAEFHNGSEVDSLDNVILSAPDHSSAVPEPGSAALVAAGLLPLLLKTRRRKSA